MILLLNLWIGYHFCKTWRELYLPSSCWLNKIAQWETRSRRKSSIRRLLRNRGPVLPKVSFNLGRSVLWTQLELLLLHLLLGKRSPCPPFLVACKLRQPQCKKEVVLAECGSSVTLVLCPGPASVVWPGSHGYFQQICTLLVGHFFVLHYLLLTNK